MFHSNKPPAVVIGIALVLIIIFLVFTVFSYQLGIATSSAPSSPTTSIYANVTNTTNNSTYVAVTFQQELNNSASDGFNLTSSMFYAASQAQCSIQLINGCNNNVPSQFVCINSQYVSTLNSQYMRIYNHSEVCPDFYMLANLSCIVQSNYCVVANSQHIQ